MSTIVSLVHYLAWPIVALIVVEMFREPLGKLIEMIGKRATGISVAAVKIELAQLSKASLPTVVIDNLAGTVATASGIPPIAKAIRETSQAHYVIVDVGTLDAPKWLTSRIYILATMLEHIRGTRCIVFTSGDRYVGTAVPRDIRRSLSLLFPSYERTFVSVLGEIAGRNPSSMFQRGLADGLIDQLLNAFVLNPEISRPPQPPIPPEPQWPPPGWIALMRDGQLARYENSQWISPDLLYDMLRDRMDRGVIVESHRRSEAQTTKLVVEQTGTFVAVVDDQAKLKVLIDRSRLADQVAREAARQLADDE